MDREIKFRAWDKETKRMMRVTRMDWPEWAICVGENDPKNMEEYYISERNSFKNEETDRFILMQFTGLKDKKRTKEFPDGQPIYEGDICKTPSGKIVEIIFSEEMLSVCMKSEDKNAALELVAFVDLEIIDDPKLLEKAQGE